MTTKKTLNQPTTNRSCQCLGEGVVKVFVVLDVKQLEDLLGHPISNHVGLHINVLDP
jgi:hypothetical protein